jgi:hypothetical protein
MRLAMWEHMKFKSTNGSGSLLAAYCVLSVGLVGCVMLVMLAFEKHPEMALMALGLFSLMSLTSLCAIRHRDLPSAAYAWMRGRRHPRRRVAFTFKAHKPRSEQFGTNAPPTAAHVRDLKEESNNWVPSSLPSGRRSVRSTRPS